MRLQKYMALCQVGSRRHNEDLIAQGRVAVNGVKITKQGVTVDLDKDRVTLDGKLLKPVTAKVYLLINKPEGYLTTVDDPQGRPTVFTLVPEYKGKVIPVGRLDRDSQGLLVLTNDGDFAYRMTHPKYGVKKTYRVRVDGIIGDQALDTLRKGVDLEDGITSPAKVKVLRRGKGSSHLEIVISEGKNRQVRRMCEAVGHPVRSLTRTKIENLSLSNLDTGAHRLLTEKELMMLMYRLGLSYSSSEEMSSK